MMVKQDEKDILVINGNILSQKRQHKWTKLEVWVYQIEIIILIYARITFFHPETKMFFGCVFWFKMFFDHFIVHFFVFCELFPFLANRTSRIVRSVPLLTQLLTSDSKNILEFHFLLLVHLFVHQHRINIVLEDSILFHGFFIHFSVLKFFSSIIMLVFGH